MAAHTLILPGDGSDFAHWRGLARWLWAQQIPPEEVIWLTEDTQAVAPDLFAPAPEVSALTSLAAVPERPLTVPRVWLAEAEQCLLNSDPSRFALLYRLLWRMQHEPALRHDLLDADQVQMQHWIKAVRREVHKTHAFVRFRPVALADDPLDGSGPLYVAWFEPVHHIVHAAAPFFVKRFANMRWAILTPQCSLRWWPEAPDIASLAAQGVLPGSAVQPLKGRPGMGRPGMGRPGVLSWGPGASAADAPDPDAGEGLWLTYYAHIFNPARLKVAAMCKEMPRKYWHNLPETQLISPMIQAAQARSAAMLANAPTTTQRRLPRHVLPRDSLAKDQG